MPEPKGNDVRTLAVRVSPDYHAQLSMVAQVDEMSLTDLMMTALDQYMASRREAPRLQGQGPEGTRRRRGPDGQDQGHAARDIAGGRARRRGRC